MELFLVLEISEQVVIQNDLAGKTIDTTVDAIEKSNKEHLEMFKAIRSSDPETARKIMEIHIKQLEERHIKRLENIKEKNERD